MPDDQPSQLDKFKDAARQLETDDDPERFKERIGNLVRRKGSETMTTRIVRVMLAQPGSLPTLFGDYELLEVPPIGRTIELSYEPGGVPEILLVLANSATPQNFDFMFAKHQFWAICQRVPSAAFKPKPAQETEKPE